MNNIMRMALFCGVAFATTLVSGGELGIGVAGVDVIVKQIPSKRDVTNSWGIFAFAPLPAGAYTLTFKARPAKDSKSMTRDKVIIATLSSIKIEGTKRPVNQRGLTTDTPRRSQDCGRGEGRR